MIEITDLEKYYEDSRALGPLSLTIQDGEVVGLLGLNGAGKTTTLRILACDLLPSAGRVRIDGVDVEEQPTQVRRRIGYLPDSPPLYDDMTVREYLVFVSELRGLSHAEAEQNAGEAEAKTQLSHVSGSRIGTLSHGYKQRVGIAGAIVHKPKLLILDEPISGLDPAQIVQMRELIRSLRGDHTILISSHILSEIRETCDRILVIRKGKIQASGTEEELLKTHLSRARVEIVVSADTPEAKVSELLSPVDGVHAVTFAARGEGGRTTIVDCSSDIRALLCRTLVMGGVDVLELKKQRDLESVFLELSDNSRESVVAEEEMK